MTPGGDFRRDSASRLVTEALSVHFDGIKAVREVDLQVERGEILGLIGPNGAGKTTLLNTITGFVEPTHGSVKLNGYRITGKDPSGIARIGLARTFQTSRLFGGLTVFENVEAAALFNGQTRHDAHKATAELLIELELDPRSSDQAGTLPHGHARRLEIARALATNPTFLLLDEPAAGLNDDESASLVEDINRIRLSRGIGVLIIEHDMTVVMRLCDRIHVLSEGTTLAVGTPDEIRANAGVVSAYLGSGASHLSP